MIEIPPPGTLLCNRYKVTSMVSHSPCLLCGGAEDTTTGNPVAIHLFYATGVSAAQWKRTFVEQAARLTELPNLGQPKLLDQIAIPDMEGVVFEWLEGQQIIWDKDRQKASEVLPWALDIAGLLRQLHGRPTPIFVRSSRSEILWKKADGKGTLLRFGVPEPPVQTSFVSGVSRYQAPETYGNPNREATSEADTYWLGAIMYHALSGTPPPSGLSRTSRKAVLARPDGLPDKLWQVLDSMLSVSPAKRPSAADVQRGLLLIQ